MLLSYFILLAEFDSVLIVFFCKSNIYVYVTILYNITIRGEARVPSQSCVYTNVNTRVCVQNLLNKQ